MDTLSYKLGSFETEIVFINKVDALDIKNSTDFVTVFDKNTKKIFDYSDDCLVIKPGEKYKDWKTVKKMLDYAFDREFGRDCCFVGVGGGVICDMTAFASAIYMRGCPVVLVPTTLLAMVDAAFGGKSGVDYRNIKNLVGSFYPAKQVRISIDSLDTLPHYQFMGGMAEIIKAALLDDKDLLKILKNEKKHILNRDKSILKDIVKKSIMVKGKIVEADLTEKGIRAHLNLGHTFAHSLETVTNYKWGHGQAVAWGIDKALKAGIIDGITDKKYYEDVKTFLEDYGYDLNPVKINPDKLCAVMNKDKKKKDGKVRFVLQKDLCSTIIKELDTDTIKKAIS